MRSWSAAVFILLVACGGPSAPAEPVSAPVASVSAAPPPVASVSAEPPPAPSAKEPEPPKSNAHFKVTTAMKMDGKIDDKLLITEVNAQIDPVSACAPIIRKTDHVTGSLNLQITVAKDGTTKPDLQSPASAEAKKCILDAVGKWKLSPKVGAGNAMVLLSFVE